MHYEHFTIWYVFSKFNLLWRYSSILLNIHVAELLKWSSEYRLSYKEQWKNTLSCLVFKKTFRSKPRYDPTRFSYLSLQIRATRKSVCYLHQDITNWSTGYITTLPSGHFYPWNTSGTTYKRVLTLVKSYIRNTLVDAGVKHSSLAPLSYFWLKKTVAIETSTRALLSSASLTGMIFSSSL